MTTSDARSARLSLIFSSIGHTFSHLFQPLYYVAVLSLEGELGLTHGEAIQLAVLGGVLLFVAWNMGEWREFAKLRHFSVPYRVLLLSTFSVTVVFDLTVAVQLGLVLACVFFILRQQDIFRVHIASTDASQTIDVKLYGSLFFGTVGKLDALLVLAERCQPGQEVVLHAQRLITLDTTGLDALRQLADGLQRRGAHLSMLGVQPQPASLLGRSGFALRLHRLEIEKA